MPCVSVHVNMPEHKPMLLVLVSVSFIRRSPLMFVVSPLKKKQKVARHASSECSKNWIADTVAKLLGTEFDLFDGMIPLGTASRINRHDRPG